MIQHFYLVRKGADIASCLRRALENGASLSLRQAKKNLSAKTADEEVLVVSAGKDWAKALQGINEAQKDEDRYYIFFPSPTPVQNGTAPLDAPLKKASAKDKTGLENAEKQKRDEPCLDELIEKKLSHFVSKISQSEGKNLYDLLIQEVEKPLIKFALKATEGNRVQASQLLGMHRNTLRKKMKDLKIESGKALSR